MEASSNFIFPASFEPVPRVRDRAPDSRRAALFPSGNVQNQLYYNIPGIADRIRSRKSGRPTPIIRMKTKYVKRVGELGVKEDHQKEKKKRGKVTMYIKAESKAERQGRRLAKQQTRGAIH